MTKNQKHYTLEFKQQIVVVCCLASINIILDIICSHELRNGLLALEYVEEGSSRQSRKRT